MPAQPFPDFRDLPSLVAEHAALRPDADALCMGEQRLSYAQLDAGADRHALALQQAGLGPGDCIALCAQTQIDAVLLFLGALRAGLAVAPLAPGSTPAQLAAMASDCQARRICIDDSVAALQVPWPTEVPLWRLQDPAPAPASPPARPTAVAIAPAWPFNIIYSSGTTGTPKGIVQAHAMRWAHIQRAHLSGYGPDTVTLIATPLYSNTTLVCLIPTLAHGGCVVLCAPRFDALSYLRLAEQHRATHTMLVPVQYQRLMDHPAFGDFDLSSFQTKFCTSAPFHAPLKADVLARWPGALVEYYGLTEGGGTCVLQAHLHPLKLHTVGQPAEGHDIRLIDEAGAEIARQPAGASLAEGEVVGRSPGMMTGYHGQPALTAQAEWFDTEGRRYIRTGDIGRFDDDGFLVLLDRRKDMLISGGFNVYPSDLEAVLRGHPAVADVAVAGVPSREWGETPVAFVVLAPGAASDAAALQAWANGRLGKTQRLSALHLLPELPRSAIGKVLKRELRELAASLSAAAPPSGPVMAVLRVALATFVALAAGLHPGPAMAAATPTGRPAEPAQASSSPSSEGDGPALRAQVHRLIGRAACDSDAQCRTLPLGARACGGPEAHVAWSVHGTDQAALRRAAERYTDWQAQQAQQAQAQGRRGEMSICMIEIDPGAVCAKPPAPDRPGTGRCVLGNAAAGSATR